MDTSFAPPGGLGTVSLLNGNSTLPPSPYGKVSEVIELQIFSCKVLIQDHLQIKYLIISGLDAYTVFAVFPPTLSIANGA